MLICSNCFSNKDLNNRIQKIVEGTDHGRCDFHRRKKGIPISEISPIIADVISNSYYKSDFNTHTGEPNGITLSDVIYDLVEPTEDQVAEELQRRLIDEEPYWPPDGDEPFFSDESGYERHSFVHEEHSFRWERFCREIVHERRFFSPDAIETLKEIFDGIHTLRNQSKQPIIYELKPGGSASFIFRARVSNDSSSREKIAQDPPIVGKKSRAQCIPDTASRPNDNSIFHFVPAAPT